ncbi:MAG: hypothetical protein PHT76_15015 [Anaerostipes sp.]|nr:hypothetical protein [Anaerostipes sp.]MDD3503893.1 hypothetical protein [Eubacteriales bacterium]
MRYDTPVFFQKVSQGAYNEETGDYLDESVDETQKYASVMDTGADMLQVVYGKLVQGSLSIQLQNHYQNIFDRIRIGNKLYKADYIRKLKVKETLIVSEVM